MPRRTTKPRPPRAPAAIGALIAVYRAAHEVSQQAAADDQRRGLAWHAGTIRLPVHVGHRQIASILVGAALLIAACSMRATPSAQTAAGLKSIDGPALRALVDKTAQELLVPGAVVLLRTPQGDFTAASGTTQLGIRHRPGAATHF